MCIGSSLGFLLVYGVVDLAEIAKRLCFGLVTHDTSMKGYEPAILTNLLYLLMMSMGIVMGGGLGIVYGVADVEGLFD